MGERQPFTVNGERVDLSRADVYTALRGHRPGPMRQRRWVVKIRKHDWPAKEAVERVLAAHGWTSSRPVPTVEARRVLETLGFTVRHIEMDDDSTGRQER